MKAQVTGALRAANLALEAEIQAELQSHLEELRDALVESGVDPIEAERRALARFGNFENTVRDCVAERRTENDPMKATLIALVVLLGAGLLITAARARRVQAEQAVSAAEMHELAAFFEREKLQKEMEAPTPRPVVYSVGDLIRVSDIDGSGPDQTVRVAEDGMALLPDLGWIQVHGKQRELLEAELQERYEAFFQDLSQIVVERR